ncbi:alpha/beta hydrolase [Streptomyces hygroscopicus]|uniref:alpha/beta hydrolase n=1 Tax=Streptomyces hygroscopicus TaxID=1912 RepID=UPI0033F72FF5
MHTGTYQASADIDRRGAPPPPGPRRQPGGHEAGTGNHPHTTVIGHSYGSTVIGDATKSHTSYDPHGGALPVDDIIAAGSPGMQVGHASDLGIGSDHDD